MKHETQRPKRLGISYIVLTEDRGRWLDKPVMMVTRCLASSANRVAIASKGLEKASTNVMNEDIFHMAKINSLWLFSFHKNCAL